VAYDEELAQRIRDAVQGEPGVSEKKMFGGLAFLVHGNMALSASGQGGVLLRVDPAETEALVAQPHVHRFRMGGREMDGWVHLDAEPLTEDEELRHWVSIGVRYARSLPAK